MQVTVCEICRKQGGNPARIDKWVKISFSEGKLANFFERTNRKIELCEECFDRITNPPISHK